MLSSDHKLGIKYMLTQSCYWI